MTRAASVYADSRARPGRGDGPTLFAHFGGHSCAEAGYAYASVRLVEMRFMTMSLLLIGSQVTATNT